MADLAAARAREKGNGRQLRVVSCELEGADAVRGGVADIVATVAILGIEIRLEGEDTKDLVAVLSDAMYAPFLPRPYLRRDIIIDFRIGQMAFAERGNAKVKRRIVDEDKSVWPFME